MPFDQFTPRILSLTGVNAYAPPVSGVYGISNAREWIYIGETDNIQFALLDHLQKVNTAIMKRHPTGFVFEVCDQAKRAARQDRLVLEYEPTVNRRGALAATATKVV